MANNTKKATDFDGILATAAQTVVKSDESSNDRIIRARAAHNVTKNAPEGMTATEALTLLAGAVADAFASVQTHSRAFSRKENGTPTGVATLKQGASAYALALSHSITERRPRVMDAVIVAYSRAVGVGNIRAVLDAHKDDDDATVQALFTLRKESKPNAKSTKNDTTEDETIPGDDTASTIDTTDAVQATRGYAAVVLPLLQDADADTLGDVIDALAPVLKSLGWE